MTNRHTDETADLSIDAQPTLSEDIAETTASTLAAIGLRIRELRQLRGLTLQALADVSGLSTSMLSLVERGRASPSIGSLIVIQFYVLQYGWWPVAVYCICFLILPLLWVLRRLYTARVTADYHFLSNLIKAVMLMGILSMILVSYTSY